MADVDVAEEAWAPCVVPGVGVPGLRRETSLVRVVADSRAITLMLGQMVDRSGLTKKGVAMSMGIGYQTLHDYLTGARNPGMRWFARLAAACGAEITVSFPERK